MKITNIIITLCMLLALTANYIVSKNPSPFIIFMAIVLVLNLMKIIAN